MQSVAALPVAKSQDPPFRATLLAFRRLFGLFLLAYQRYFGRSGSLRGSILRLHLEAGRRHDRGDGEVAIGDRALGALGQSDGRDVERIADVEAGQIDLDLVGDLGGVADQLEVVTDGIEHAAALQAARI